MIDFKGIERDAAEEHGGLKILRSKLLQPISPEQLASIADDRYLSSLSKIVFQVGFNWKVVENKWVNFEKHFAGFKLNACSALSDEALEQRMISGDLIKNWPKIKAIRSNAQWLSRMTQAHGGVGERISQINSHQYLPELFRLSKEGTRVGARTSLIWMRRMGADSFVFSPDVERALFRYGVIDKAPSSANSWHELQEQLNHWMDGTGYCLTHISQILAYSSGPSG